MCEGIGYSKSLMTELKSGRKKTITLDVAKTLSDYFGVSVDYLVGKEEKPIGKANELIDIIADNILALDKEEQEKIIKLLSNPEKLKAVLSLI